ncbi:NYN domain protein [Caballeronia cordobensis]|uniref:NYN domain protein n=1 Tax=Caballeronia cordobensis TaxID=1353886 RepID=A0A158F7E6_CABCO|nr:NYN domain-containing protein [Caballeronia cordobensis]SAL15573.1 NYN domain protein [Caballeronia cordobensis]
MASTPIPLATKRLLRVGIFYDGNYLDMVRKYYMHQHKKNAWISVRGLHDYIRYKIALENDLNPKDCHLVELHYFRGRFSAQQSVEKGLDMLYRERVFEDILMKENVTTHYLPMNFAGKEKGIDVWLALEAYEMAAEKRFDVAVLIAGDSDYIPLARKLKALGMPVLALGWSFAYEDATGEQKGTRPSQLLFNEVAYPVMMSDVIDRMDNAQGDEREALNSLFQRQKNVIQSLGAGGDDWKTGTIASVLNGYGFIRPEGAKENLFFYCSALIDADFDDVYKGMEVSFQEGIGQKGPVAEKVRTT